MNPDTSVVNSRPHKKLPVIWRRRRCNACGGVFTTDESPRVSANRPVTSSAHGMSHPYNPGILLLSIATAFQHDQRRGAEVAWDITNTVSSRLSVVDGNLTTEVIKDATYETLLRFDGAAAMQYALQQGIELKHSTRKRPS